MRHVLTTLIALVAAPAAADSYVLSLGGDPIGTLESSDGGIASNVTDSPLGVGNGSFEATRTRVQMDDGAVVTQYLSRSPSKGRTISVLHDGGRVIETTVSPGTDATDLSVPAAVPAGVDDPVAALSELLRDRDGCPGSVQFYDGRRVITISPTGSGTDGAALICEMSYRVTAGPGHFSPLFIKRATMELSYEAGALTRLSVSTGPFTLNVTPR